MNEVIRTVRRLNPRSCAPPHHDVVSWVRAGVIRVMDLFGVIRWKLRTPAQRRREVEQTAERLEMTPEELVAMRKRAGQ